MSRFADRPWREERSARPSCASERFSPALPYLLSSSLLVASIYPRDSQRLNWSPPNSLRSFPNLNTLLFKSNGLATFQQLSELSGMAPQLRHLSISDNPVLSLSLFRPFVAHRLPSVVLLNGHRVTDAERVWAKATFEPAFQRLQVVDTTTRERFKAEEP